MKIKVGHPGPGGVDTEGPPHCKIIFSGNLNLEIISSPWFIPKNLAGISRRRPLSAHPAWPGKNLRPWRKIFLAPLDILAERIKLTLLALSACEC